jgi:hypothetical protein
MFQAFGGGFCQMTIFISGIGCNFICWHLQSYCALLDGRKAQMPTHILALHETKNHEHKQHSKLCKKFHVSSCISYGKTNHCIIFPNLRMAKMLLMIKICSTFWQRTTMLPPRCILHLHQQNLCEQLIIVIFNLNLHDYV